MNEEEEVEFIKTCSNKNHLHVGLPRLSRRWSTLHDDSGVGYMNSNLKHYQILIVIFIILGTTGFIIFLMELTRDETYFKPECDCPNGTPQTSENSKEGEVFCTLQDPVNCNKCDEDFVLLKIHGVKICVKQGQNNQNQSSLVILLVSLIRLD